MTLSETPMPLFYQKPVPLNTELHGAMTLGASPQGYRFAPTPDERILPVVLLGLERNENLFVDDRGAWLNQYLSGLYPPGRHP